MDLEYAIKTSAELAGAQAVQVSLEKQIGAAKALGKDYSDLQKQYNQVTASINEYNVSAAKQAAIEEQTSQRVRDGLQARAKINQEISDSVHTVSQEEIVAATTTLEDDAKVLGGKEQIREALHGLGLEFPILHRIARFALNGVAQAFGLAAGAIALWVAKVREGRAELEQMEMPDFQIEQVNAATQAWNGLAEARRKANDAFTSGEEIYKRAIANLRDILELQKQQLELEKNQALAQLELQKSQMTPAQYEAARKRIEGIFGQAEQKATADERREEIARKMEEKANLEIEARNKAAAAKKLPQADAAHAKAEQDALTKELDAINQKIEAQKKSVEFLQHYNELNQNPAKNLGTKEGIAAAAEYGFKYGALTDPEKQEQFEKQQLADMKKRADWVRNLMTRRDAQMKERDRLRQEAEAAAGKAQQIGDELPDDVAMFQRHYGPLIPPPPRPNIKMPDVFVDSRTSGEAAQDRLKAVLGKSDPSQFSWGKFSTTGAGATPAPDVKPAMDATTAATHKVIATVLAGFQQQHDAMTAGDAALAQKLKELAARQQSHLTP